MAKSAIEHSLKVMLKFKYIMNDSWCLGYIYLTILILLLANNLNLLFLLHNK